MSKISEKKEKFRFTAIKANGDETSGELFATSRVDASQQIIRDMGLFPTSVQRVCSIDIEETKVGKSNYEGVKNFSIIGLLMLVFIFISIIINIGVRGLYYRFQYEKQVIKTIQKIVKEEALK